MGARETRREGRRKMWESREAIKLPGNYRDVGSKRRAGRDVGKWLNAERL